MFIEQGPIRPPSEATSLLIRVTRNCPWNRCTFCSTYKGKQFSRRTATEVLRDIDTVKNIVEQIKQLSRDKGLAGRVNNDVVNQAGSRFGHLHYHVAQWLYYGGRNVFLQDANSLVLKTADLAHIIRYIRDALPAVKRLTTYARANTVCRKSVDELKELRSLGLARVHMGMESGSDLVLKMIQKGVTAAQLTEAAGKAREAGISLCWYIMPGLGGRELWREHALETAAVINRGNPDFIRFRTLSVLKKTPLYQMVVDGNFTPLDEDEVVREQRLLLENLHGINTTVVSDHILNLLQELEGTLPGDRDRLLGIIDRYLALPPAEKANFQMGRRAGIYASLDDMRDQGRYRYVEKLISSIGGAENLNRELSRIRRRFV